MTDGEKKPTSWLDGASKTVIVVLGVAVVAAGLGWAEVYGSRQEMAAVQARLAEAGLDASDPARLDVTIAAKQRELTRVESALVSYSAAAEARLQQVAANGAKADRLSGEAAAAVAATNEAQKRLAALEPLNRELSRRVSELESASVSFEAAAGARRAELDELIAAVEANADLVAEIAMWKEKGSALTAAQSRLEREVVGMENKLVALTSATEFRMQEVAKAVQAKGDAETELRAATVTTLEMRAEALDLQRSIADMGEEHERVAKALVAVNNRFIPAMAAVTAREKQLTELAAKVSAAQASYAALTASEREVSTQLALADDRLRQMSDAAQQASQYLAAITEVLATPTLQAAMK